SRTRSPLYAKTAQVSMRRTPPSRRTSSPGPRRAKDGSKAERQWSRRPKRPHSPLSLWERAGGEGPGAGVKTLGTLTLTLSQRERGQRSNTDGEKSSTFWLDDAN